MRVISVNKGRTLKTVTIEAPKSATKDSLVDFACKSTNENRSSLFGWSVCYWPVSENWTVELHTD